MVNGECWMLNVECWMLKSSAHNQRTIKIKAEITIGMRNSSQPCTWTCNILDVVAEISLLVFDLFKKMMSFCCKTKSI